MIDDDDWDQWYKNTLEDLQRVEEPVDDEETEFDLNLPNEKKEKKRNRYVAAASHPPGKPGEISATTNRPSSLSSSPSRSGVPATASQASSLRIAVPITPLKLSNRFADHSGSHIA